MLLSEETLDTIIPKNNLSIPGKEYFNLPEKVMQFGTGVLLRGLPDYFIDNANKQGVFNGRIVVVKSTAAGTIDEFAKQDGLYTLCVKGIEDGELKEENIINASISRVLSASTEWNKILDCAANPDIQIVISNTTEVGLELVNESIHNTLPASFPGKLLAFLYKRYADFRGDANKGLVIIPTELIPDNGKKLKAVLTELAVFNKLDAEFVNWLNQHNHFCSSLVDRIVPGKLSPAKHTATETELDYKDDLMIMSELYSLWAIESAEQKVHDLLSFSKTDPGVVIAPDIHVFRELKLRLLNGAHTYSCGLAHLAGFKLVKDAMSDDLFSGYITGLMENEIIPAITSNGITTAMAKAFAAKVLDRFRNPYIDHAWLSITLQYSSKMKMRNVPTLLNHYKLTTAVPPYMALGFAAHLLFMRISKNAEGKFSGNWNSQNFIVNDDNAAIYAERWNVLTQEEFVHKTLSDKTLWGHDLSALPGFEKAVIENLQLLIQQGAKVAIEKTKQHIL